MAGAVLTSDEVRRWVRWLGWFLNNMPQTGEFEPTDAEADLMAETFTKRPDDMSAAWQVAADIWEAREA